MPDDYDCYVRGLELAVEDVQRMRTYALSAKYKEAYVCALDEVLVRLRAMLARVQRNEYPHPVSNVQDALEKQLQSEDDARFASEVARAKARREFS